MGNKKVVIILTSLIAIFVGLVLSSTYYSNQDAGSAVVNSSIPAFGSMMGNIFFWLISLQRYNYQNTEDIETIRDQAIKNYDFAVHSLMSLMAISIMITLTTALTSSLVHLLNLGKMDGNTIALAMIVPLLLISTFGLLVFVYRKS